MGFLLLQNRRYASALRCALYGMLAFFLPFFAYDGLATFRAFMDNLLHGISVSTDILYRVDLGGVLGSIANWFGGSEATATALGAKLAFPYLLVMLGCSLLQKQSWKVCLGLALISTLFPGFSFYYAAAFYILPVFLFVQSREERKPVDLVYAVLMAGLLLTLMCPDSWRFVVTTDYGVNGRVLSSYSIDICKACEALLSFLLLGDGIATLVTRRRAHPALSRA
ncbi:MAG: hypothetical protein EOM66_12200 [Clostridia bacterium]|nr:hypothetical protein [Clostridia bacterium]